jgi:hypothetical protein
MKVRPAEIWTEVDAMGLKWTYREMPSITRIKRGWWIFSWWEVVEVVTALPIQTIQTQGAVNKPTL